MNKEDFIKRERERARRLLEFVKGEIREMHVEARMEFTVELFNYLRPELEELIRCSRINKIK